MGLHAVNLEKKIGQKILLKGISFEIKPGEFIGIIGPSGAGKTLLLGALSGTKPATDGKVLLNGEDLYLNFSSKKMQISYVPQDDIVHTELSVYQSIYYTGRLRLSPALSQLQITKRVAEILDFLEIGHVGESRISTLSGGERKRVNIGAELLTEPKYIFLDEPMAGLDFRSESRLMEFLKGLSRKETSVIMTTHVLTHIDKFDRVAILGEGRLLFFGSPQDVLRFFDVAQFNEIYEEINQLPSEEWESRYRQSPYCSDTHPVEIRTRDELFLEVDLIASVRKVWLQFWTLSARLADIRLADWRSTSILMLQVPLVAWIMVWVTKNEFLPMVFVLLGLWAGCINSVRDVVREWTIYSRERIIGLNLAAYLGSKLIGIAWLSAVQAFCVIAIFKIFVSFPGSFLNYYWIFFFVSFLGGLLGLFISVISHNADLATFLIPVFLLPQFGYSGVLVPIQKMSPIHQAISTLCVSRWGTQCFVDIYLEDISQFFLEGILGLCLLSVLLILSQWLILRLRDVQRGGFG